MTRVWLIRHGEPVAEAHGRCYGALDFHLSANGRARMAQVAQYISSEPLAAICASPRSRARQSAEIIAAAHTCPVEVIPDLCEMNFGDLEGLPYDEIATRYPALYREWMETPTRVRFPNGENFSEVRTRVLHAFDTIQRRHEGQTIAIVSHGGTNRILLARALQIPDACIFRLAQDYAATNLLTLTNGIPTVQTMNRCG
jgi:alpha-ribazole phosphatase